MLNQIFVLEKKVFAVFYTTHHTKYIPVVGFLVRLKLLYTSLSGWVASLDRSDFLLPIIKVRQMRVWVGFSI